MWGTRNLSRVGLYIASQCLSGRYEADSKEMATLVGRIRSEEPHRFGEVVATQMRATSSQWIVRERVTSIGGRRLERFKGQPIGDVDVLVVIPARKRILALEVKDFSLARTPHEMASAHERLFVGEGSAVAHHQERLDWLRQHLDHVVNTFGCSSKGTWRVEGAIVSSEQLLTPSIATSPMPVFSLNQLASWVNRFL